MPPHAPCRLQRFINSTDEIEVHLCLHTPRADCNQKMQSRCARQVLCLHTPRADCNISPCVVKGKEYRLCLHTPRADCNCTTPSKPTPARSLPPHAPCRLQPMRKSPVARTLTFASTRPVQIATAIALVKSHKRQDFASTRPVQIATCGKEFTRIRLNLCLHTPRADCNLDFAVLIPLIVLFASTRPVQIATAEMHRIAICTFQNVC